ncbi:MAG: dynamin family protein [Nostocales cyanobacterium 94392]|nr:dynamin family protein [Nostocales cyanobacterium 94392]
MDNLVDNLTLQEHVESLFQFALTESANRPALQKFHRILEESHLRLNQPMRVAIVGLIKAGKSTLMNSLLGEAVVATGTVEATFNVNWLKYNSQPSLLVHFKDGRSPEPKSFEELKALTVRAKEHQEYLLSIKYIEVGYPNEILRTLSLIDTPGLESYYKDDSNNTLEFLKLHGQNLTQVTEAEASNADAVLYLFSQSIATTDKSIVETFTGQSLGQATPINAIGVLTKVDAYWSDYENPMEAGEKVTKRLSEHPQVKSLFYNISPVCGLLAFGAQTLTLEEFEILLELAKVPANFLESKLRVEERFTQREYQEIPISPAKRQLVWKRLGQYGVWLACSLICQGINNQKSLSEQLLQHSGVSNLRNLITSHFGNRAFLIKLNTGLRQIAVARFQERIHLQGVDLQILEDIAGKFEALESQEHSLQELQILRIYYEKKLDFDEEEAKQLLEITGEYGISYAQRLGLDQQATVPRMIQVATERMQQWYRVANDAIGVDRQTIYAAQVMARSYEGIVHRLSDAKKHLGL